MSQNTNLNLRILEEALPAIGKISPEILIEKLEKLLNKYNQSVYKIGNTILGLVESKAEGLAITDKIKELEANYGEEITWDVISTIIGKSKIDKSSQKQSVLRVVKPLNEKGSSVPLTNSIDAELKMLSKAKEAVLRQQFMAQVNQAKLEANKPTLELPDKAPELWKSGQGETALEFLQRVYKDYLEAEVLTWGWLNQHDPKLRNAVNANIRQGKKVQENTKLPVTESTLLDKEHEELIRQYGQEVVDRIFRVKSSLSTRKSRQNKKKVGELELDKK